MSASKKKNKPRRLRLSEVMMYQLAARQLGSCGICFQPLNANEVTVDHIVHVSRGGSDVMRNMRLACKACNLKRGTKL